MMGAVVHLNMGGDAVGRERERAQDLKLGEVIGMGGVAEKGDCKGGVNECEPSISLESLKD